MTKRELARVPIRLRDSDVTRSAWRVEIDSDDEPAFEFQQLR